MRLLSLSTIHPFQPAPSLLNALGEQHRRHLITPHTPQSLDYAHAESGTTYLRRINETVLRHTSVAIVIIDRSYRILTINAAARRLLAVRDLAYDHDFLHTVRGLPYHEVRKMIDAAFREHSTMVLPDLELDRASEGSGKYLTLSTMAMQLEQGASELAVITAMDVTEQAQIKKRLEAVQHEQTELVSELSATNKRFSTMKKELQDANEELQAAN